MIDVQVWFLTKKYLIEKSENLLFLAKMNVNI